MCYLFTFSLFPNRFSKSSKVPSFFKDVSLQHSLEASLAANCSDCKYVDTKAWWVLKRNLQIFIWLSKHICFGSVHTPWRFSFTSKLLMAWMVAKQCILNKYCKNFWKANFKIKMVNIIAVKLVLKQTVGPAEVGVLPCRWNSFRVFSKGYERSVKLPVYTSKKLDC